MKVRSLTAFDSLDGDRPIDEVVSDAGKFLRAGRRMLQEAGVEVQTVRMALGRRTLAHAADPVGLARDVEAACEEAEVEYVSLGPVPVARVAVVPDVIAATERVFLAATVAGEQGLDERAIGEAAAVVRSIAGQGADGFGNLRFAAIARCPAHIPFFPAAYHDDNGPAVAVALQAADLVAEAIGSAAGAEHAPSAIAARIEQECGKVDAAVRRVAKRRGRRYVGIDISPAPFPDERTSLAGAIEALSGRRFGDLGTATAAAAIVEGLRQAKVQRTGFSGLMLPVLEDAILARRTIEGSFGTNELLLCSALCGTGLDTVPLPGDSSAEDLAALIRDVASLAVRLNKPLTARLLPVPGKQVGDETTFDFPYFANGRVLPLGSRIRRV